MGLKWKHKNEYGQVMSQCDRFWFVDTDLSVFQMCEHNLCCDDAADGSSLFLRLWHDDSETIVGYFASASEAKAAAQSHLDGLKRPDRVEDDGGPTAEDLGHAPGEKADDTITACPICGAEIQATEELWLDRVCLSSNGREMVDYGSEEHGDVRIYCKNDHTHAEIQFYLRGGRSVPDAFAELAEAAKKWSQDNQN